MLERSPSCSASGSRRPLTLSFTMFRVLVVRFVVTYVNPVVVEDVFSVVDAGTVIAGLDTLGEVTDHHVGYSQQIPDS